MMKIRMVGLAYLAFMATTSPVHAQRGGARGRGASAERVLRMREQLALTEQQIAQLNEIRTAELARRTTSMAAIMERRSRVAAGELARADAQAQMAEQRVTQSRAGSAVRDQLNGILTEEQRGQLRTRARRGGRGAVARGQRGGRVGMRSSRGRGQAGIRRNRGGGRRNLHRGRWGQRRPQTQWRRRLGNV